MPAGARILWIAPSWLGDAVLSLPALQWLQTAGVQVDVLVRRGSERIFSDCVPPAQVHRVSPLHRAQRLAAAWRLRALAFAAAVVLPPSFSAALLARASGARLRLGERGHGRAALLTHALPPAGRSLHLARGYQRLAAATLAALAGAAAARRVVPAPADGETLHSWPHLTASAAEVQAATALLGASGIGTRDVLVVAPGARFGAAKRYPAALFARAAGAASAEFAVPIVLVGGTDDTAATAAVRAHLGDAVDLAGRTSLAALLGLLAGARGVLSNDSGVMHVAAALGTPVVGIFGSTNPEWTGPLGRRATHIVHAVPCAPCYQRRCPIDFPCMHGIAPETVVMALRGVLAADRRGVPEGVAPL